MATVVLGDEPVIEQWLEQRRALGQNKRDEVWEGDYHVAPHEHARNGNLAMQLVVLGPRARAAGLTVGVRQARLARLRSTTTLRGPVGQGCSA